MLSWAEPVPVMPLRRIWAAGSAATRSSVPFPASNNLSEVARAPVAAREEPASTVMLVLATRIKSSADNTDPALFTIRLLQPTATDSPMGPLERRPPISRVSAPNDVSVLESR